MLCYVKGAASFERSVLPVVEINEDSKGMWGMVGEGERESCYEKKREEEGIAIERESATVGAESCF